MPGSESTTVQNVITLSRSDRRGVPNVEDGQEHPSQAENDEEEQEEDKKEEEEEEEEQELQAERSKPKTSHERKKSLQAVSEQSILWRDHEEDAEAADLPPQVDQMPSPQAPATGELPPPAELIHLRLSKVRRSTHQSLIPRGVRMSHPT